MANPWQGMLDPKTAAAIAEQQSIYSPENLQNSKARTIQRQKTKGARATVVREGGGKVWEDPSLLEWDSSHFRLFCGDLGGEVSDDLLYKSFAPYGSIVKARVVRDKRTTKSKGFGFVSFREADDMLRAWREMNGKYIGSHPVKLSRAQTEVKKAMIEQKGLEKKQAKSRYNKAVTAGRVEKR